jgi:EmrB/QacA subfamily drug resistance transporter
MSLSPSLEQARGHRWAVLAVLSISLVVVVVGNVSLNVALPRISTDLQASFTSLQWMVDAYSLLFAGLLLFAGAIGDRFGRKGALQGGLVVFGTASLAASFASASWQVIAARAVMGIAAAFIMPGTLSILAVVFPPRERPRAIAIWAGVAGASVAIGLVWSGILLEHFWWGSVFLTNVPIIVVALVLGAVILPRSSDPTKARLDKVGALLSVGALATLLYALIQGPVTSWTSGTILGAFAAAVVLLAAFIWWERRVPEPMLDLSFFDDRRFSLGCISIFGAFLCLFGVYFLLTQYLQEVRGYSPLEAGLYALPAGITQLVVAPMSAHIVERVGYRAVMGTGLLLVSGGTLMLAFMSLTSPLWILFLGLAILGAGLGAATPPATGAIIAGLPARKAGVGSAVNDTTRELGGAVGIALLGSLLTSHFRSGISGAVGHLPASARDTAGHGVSEALGVAGKLPGTAGAALADAARHAFASGMLRAFTAGAVLAFLAAVVVFRYLPKGLRPRDDDPDAAPPSDEDVRADEPREAVSHA